MTSIHNPLLYTDAECLKACADSGNLLIRKAGERWAQAKKDHDLLVGQNIDVCAYNERLLNERNAAITACNAEHPEVAALRAELAAARALLKRAMPYLLNADVRHTQPEQLIEDVYTALKEIVFRAGYAAGSDDLAAVRALLREARQELPPIVEANQPEWHDMLDRIDAALKEPK